MAAKGLEIICTACGEDAFIKREPVYDGFKKTGEKLCCTSCGYEYENEDNVPFKESKKVSIFDESDVSVKPSIFTDDDVSEKVEVFDDNEKQRNCRYCGHYLVNPFTQRCGLHFKEVLATDVCDDFKKEEEQDTPESEDN